MEDPANELFQKLLDSEEARENVVVDALEDERVVRVKLDHGDTDIETLLSPRAASEYLDDLEMQAEQMGLLDEVDEVLTTLRDATYDAGTQ